LIVAPDQALELMRDRVEGRIAPLLQRSADLGFLGGMPLQDQIDHSLGFVSAVELALGHRPDSVVDLGTGGGVPGLVLHSCWPGCRVVLVDGNQRRTEFLSAEVEGWGSSSPEVVRGRAEELGRDDRYRDRFEVVTARSFGPPAVTAECGAPLLGLGGILVVSEPPEESETDRWPEGQLSELGLVPEGRMRFDERFGYQVLRKTARTPDRYPRRIGIPSKRPLF
jgi:16S rRNA (guanine527-N7)-methyltransferase